MSCNFLPVAPAQIADHPHIHPCDAQPFSQTLRVENSDPLRSQLAQRRFEAIIPELIERRLRRDSTLAKAIPPRLKYRAQARLMQSSRMFDAIDAADRRARFGLELAPASTPLAARWHPISQSWPETPQRQQEHPQLDKPLVG